MKKILNILHLDDSPKDAAYIEDFIKSKGIDAEIIHVASKNEFDKELLSHSFDLIFCDYSIPGFSGEEALIEAKNYYPETPVIFISGTIGEESAVELLKKGATDYILKDNLKRLIPAVGRAVDEAALRKSKFNAEKELYESKYFVQRIIETSPNLIYVYDVQNRITVFSNMKWKHFFGYDSSEIENMGDSFLEALMHPDDLTLLDERHLKFNGLADGDIIENEYRMMHKDGSWRWVQSYEAIFARDENGLPYHIIGVAQDATSKKKIEHDLVLAKENAEISDRMKSEFLAQMSHEIRTPLSAILNYTDILKMELKDKIEEHIYDMIFNGLDSSGRRLIRTIDLILNMSLVQTGKYEAHFQPINLEELLRKLIGEFYSLAAAGSLSLKLTISSYIEPVMLDEYTVSQIFQNLLDNAIKYTEAGGVEIKLYKNENNDLCADVIDSGIGISEEYFKNLFKPFTQEATGYSRKYEGNGLGLALIKKYIEINNAEIKVKSEKNKGTTFTIIFKNTNKSIPSEEGVLG